MKERYNVGVVGATGLVGRTIIRILEESGFPLEKLGLFASSRSAGSIIYYQGNPITVEELTENSFDGMDIALFSAGATIGRQYAPIAASYGCVVIDNGSYWRMHPDVPLVVPEVNPEALSRHHGIIANPNCSTIQLMVALKPIVDSYIIKRVVVSTYQSISGAGQKGLNKLNYELEGFDKREGKHRIAFSAMFHPVSDNPYYTVEEKKMIDESRKILGIPDLKLNVTCVRLPILGGHAETVNIEFDTNFDIDEIRRKLAEFPGIIVMDDLTNEEYPTPEISADTNPVYVGRIRRDDTVDNGLNLWVVADNLRKGAATNAVQIAEKVVANNHFSFEAANFDQK